jgi:ferredoxin-type protein NapH
MSRYYLSFFSSLLTFILLSFVHLKLDLTMMVAERFFVGGGWVEIGILTFYSGFLMYKMHDKKNSARWRTISWLIFSIFFFSQLVLGIFADERFLLTGKLHLPVPAMILSGTVYRMKISFMPVLFLSTILLTGPAWCSHLCYFGAIDNWGAGKKGLRNVPLKNKIRTKFIVLFLIISFTLLLKILGTDTTKAALFGIILGIAGVLIIVFISKRKKKMVHCTVFCPIGTVTSLFKYISPFRMSITNSCTTCMACMLRCKYDALNLGNIKKRKPGFTCTYCGDCLSACHEKSIRYHFLGLKPEASRNLYLLLTISIHAAFLGLGRI